MAWMASVSVTDHSGFTQEQLMTQNEGQDASRPAPRHLMPDPQYPQNSHIPLYSLNVECPCKPHMQTLVASWQCCLGRLWETVSTGPRWRTHVLQLWFWPHPGSTDQFPDCHHVSSHSCLHVMHRAGVRPSHTESQK